MDGDWDVSENKDKDGAGNGDGNEDGDRNGNEDKDEDRDGPSTSQAARASILNPCPIQAGGAPPPHGASHSCLYSTLHSWC